MSLNNCLIFAVLESIKQRKCVVIRKSRREYKWPFCHYHFLIIPKGIIREYAIGYVLISEFLEAIKEGKYVAIKKSRKDHKWPFGVYNLLILPKSIIDEHAISFVPVESTLGDYPPPLFRGFIQTGDLTEMEIEERSNKDRRKYSYTEHSPERRESEEDRRKNDEVEGCTE